jgi:predicted PurR-regulated permease PerM
MNPTPDDWRAYLPTPDQCRLFWVSLTMIALAALVAVCICAFFGFLQVLSWSYPFLLPLGLAVLVALVCKPVVDFLEARGMPRMPSTLAVCVLLVAAFIIFWAFILPPIYNETVSLVHAMPGLIDNAKKQLLIQTRDTWQVHDWLETNIPVFQRDLPKYAGAALGHILAPVGSAFGFILGFGFVPIYVFYFIADQDHLAKHWQEFVPLRPGRLRDEAIVVATEFSQVLVNYLRGQIIVAAVNGLLTFVGLTIIGVPYSLVLGVVAGALSIVPFLGIIASILPALILGFISAGDDKTMIQLLPHNSWILVKPLLVLLVFVLVQMSESMFVSPRVQSHSTGLHPLVIILGILIWSMLLPGLLGPIVAVPLTCAIVVLLRRYVWRDVPRRKRGKEKVESSGPA